jgi:hypothetical protein
VYRAEAGHEIVSDQKPSTVKRRKIDLELTKE